MAVIGAIIELASELASALQHVRRSPFDKHVATLPAQFLVLDTKYQEVIARVRATQDRFKVGDVERLKEIQTDLDLHFTHIRRLIVADLEQHKSSPFPLTKKVVLEKNKLVKGLIKRAELHCERLNNTLKAAVDCGHSLGEQGCGVADRTHRQKTVTGILEYKIYSFEELDRATNKFSEDNKLGSGGFGTVYKGTLDNGTIVAVKRTNNLGGNFKDEFLNEISILSQVNHRHLVKLLGCCMKLDVPLLVFEFISNGTVQQQLVRLDWATRFKISIQTAEALKYLHCQATPTIFHRDVKSANILLDDNYDVKVADFGLSKLVDLEKSHVSTIVRGTFGYLDPEYYRTSQITDKTDVYSFGVVLLELVTSRKPVDLSRETRFQNLAVASSPAIRAGRTREIVDPNFFSDSFTEDDYAVVEGVAQIAAACLATDRESRPSMKEVVEMLQSLQRGTAPNALDFLARNSYVDGFEMENGYNSASLQSRVGNSGQASSSTSNNQPESSEPTTVSPSCFRMVVLAIAARLTLGTASNRSSLRQSQ